MGLKSYLKQTGLAPCIKRLLSLASPKAPQPVLLRMVRKLHIGEQLPDPTLPEPYRLLRHGPGDESRWMEVLEASGEFGRWTMERLHKEMGATLLTGGGVFAAAGDRLVGCAAVCCMEEYRPYAILMYVAVLPGHRDKGLGRALVWEMMRVAREQKFPGMMLHTEPHRLAAVRTYFQLGFLPQVAKDAAGERQWLDILSRALLRSGE